ncbi:RND transporter, partial [Singulisphaera rosea]
MIRILLKARYLAFFAVVTLLVVLVLFGGRVSYEQSIKSFFAEDDPVMNAYQEAAKVFGDDNFIFIAYDDPELLTAGGMDRVAELAREVGPDRIRGVLRVESLDAMPLLWRIDDALLALDKLPTLLRNAALNTARRNLKTLDLKGNAFAVGGAIRAADDAG